MIQNWNRACGHTNRCLLLALLVAPIAHASDDPRVLPSDPEFSATLTTGEPIQGKIGALRLDSRGQGELKLSGEEDQTVSWDQVVNLKRTGAPAPTPPGGTLVALPDNEVLLGAIGASNGAGVEVRPALNAATPVRVPLEQTLGLILDEPTEGSTFATQLQAIRNPRRAGEVLWLGNGDRKEGSFLGLTPDQVQFDSGAGQAALDRASVVAIGFDPDITAYPKTRTPYLQLNFNDGSRLSATACRLDRGQLLIETRFGSELLLPLDRLVSATLLNGNVSYLSDREPDQASFVPYLDRHPHRFGRDETWDGQPLQMGGVAYERGIGALPRTLLAYRLSPEDRKFQALIGQDARAGDLSNVVFRVLVDRNEVFVSKPMTRQDAPVPVDVSVAGGRILILVTEFGDRGDVQDSAVWADARLVR